VSTYPEYYFLDKDRTLKTLLLFYSQSHMSRDKRGKGGEEKKNGVLDYFELEI
jgi:hypothetical protein